MSAESISIVRQFPVINGFVQLPPNRESDRAKYPISGVLSDVLGVGIDGSSEAFLSPVGANTGSKFGGQVVIEVEGQTFDLPTDSDSPYSG